MEYGITMNFIKKTLITVAFISILFPAWASAFIIRHIQVRGLQRIDRGTVLNYVPLHVGQNYRSSDGPIIINALFKTNFFSNVRLFRRRSTLVIKVVERPIIGLIKITGNKAIKRKKLNPVLKRLGIVEGQVYIPARLFEIKIGLQQEYDMLGRYAANVTVDVVPEPRNRVALYIHVHEGPIAKVRRITIVGNHAFSEGKLVSHFKLSTPGILSWYTHNDRYSRLKLQQDLAQMQAFYFDHGFLRFRIISKKVTITPDHKGVSITIHVYEGPVYHIGGSRVDGPFANDPHIQHIVSAIHVGDIFSRHQLLIIDQSIAHYFANQGFAFPKINIVPQINDKTLKVFLVFRIAPGRRVYVKRINFIGNHRTSEKILRAETQQMEGSIFSLHHVNESKRRLANLPYLKNIRVVPVPVPGEPNQVILNYYMTEVKAGKASIQGGYSDVDGFLYGASVAEPNFMGSGKYVALSFMRSRYSDSYTFDYSNPFYTPDGVSRGFSVYYTHTTPNTKLNLEPYTIDTYGGKFYYGIPISTYSTMSVGFGYDHIAVSNVQVKASPQVLTFLQQNKTPFNQFNIIFGLARSTLDRAIFPQHGSVMVFNAIVGAPVIRDSVGYLKTTFVGRWYVYLGNGFILNPHTTLGYGKGFGYSDIYPFYNNFFAGGISTLPGFAPNSLGPKNPNFSNGAIGGDVEIIGGVNLIVPNPFSHKVRIAFFLDAGNIFNTERLQYTTAQKLAAKAAKIKLAPILYEGVSLSNLRVSTGILVSWYSPLGPIEFSLGWPIVFHGHRGDRREIFGFSFGGSL